MPSSYNSRAPLRQDYSSDQIFFKRFPDRRYRIRRAYEAERQGLEIATGETIEPGDVFALFMAIRQLKPGLRVRRGFFAPRGLDCDVPDDVAATYFHQGLS